MLRFYPVLKSFSNFVIHLKMDNLEKDGNNSCPICLRHFTSVEIEKHVDKCLFLNENTNKFHSKRSCGSGESSQKEIKRFKATNKPTVKTLEASSKNVHTSTSESPNGNIHSDDKIFLTKNRQCDKYTTNVSDISTPLSESMRPSSFDEYFGQEHIMGETKLLRNMLNSNKILNMILWGPPGCGKTSLVNVISSLCKNIKSLHFEKLSAAMAGVNDIKEVIKVAKNKLKYNIKTVLFLDEIHRFNKLQQDIFLPVVESGLITLIGATTENPSFSLNSALLSRCRVLILEKLATENIMSILSKAVEEKFNGLVVELENNEDVTISKLTRLFVDRKSIQWLADISDGDARLALNSLEIAIHGRQTDSEKAIQIISLEDIKDGIKRSHMLYDRKGDEHFNSISALHKSIRASDENASLYWVTRMIESGEDPLYIARRLVRVASEDIGLADSNALSLAVSCMQGCQLIGAPECDVLLAQCTTYLARAPKSQEVYHALLKCKQTIKDHKGSQPSVPLHLRNAPTKLMKNLGYGKDYNTLHKSISNLTYMPDGMENIYFF